MDESPKGAHSSDPLPVDEEVRAATTGVGLDVEPVEPAEPDDPTPFFNFSAQRLKGGESCGEDLEARWRIF